MWQNILILKRRKKVNSNDDSLARLYQCKFVFWQKEREKIGKYTAKLTFLWYDIVVKKGSLHWNGMAAINKIRQFKLLFLESGENCLLEYLVILLFVCFIGSCVFYPPTSEARREVANLTERKNPPTPVFGVKEFVCLSVCCKLQKLGPLEGGMKFGLQISPLLN